MSLLKLLLCLLAWLPQPVLAAAGLDAGTQQLVLDRHIAILEDPGGKLSLEEVKARDADFQPVNKSGRFSLGYSKSHWWLRVEVASAADTPRHWRLHVAYPPLDSIEAWLPQGDGWATYHTGDRQPFANRPTPNIDHVFPLTLEAGKTSTLYLRIASSGSLTAPMTIFSESAYESHSNTTYLLEALYFGTLLALGVYNLLLYFSVRDRTYLLYVIFVLGMALGQAGQAGLASQYLWPDWPLIANYAFPLGFALCGLFAVCFTRAFLDTRRELPKLDRLLVSLAWTFGAGALLALADYSLGARILSAVGVLFSALTVWVGLLSWRRGNPSARIFLLAWVLLLISAAAMGLCTLDLVPTNILTLYGMQIGSALEMLLLSFALADRINHTRREKLAAQAEALAAERRLREMLEDNERRLEARVAERTQALEAANQRLQENEERFRYMAQHDPLTGLANRVLLYDRLEHLLHRSRRNDASFAVLMLDLNGFKQVNDTYGHAAGDALLVEIAGRLQKRIRASDTVARIGGDEFAFLLEPTTGGEEAQRVGDSLLAELRQPITLENGTIVSVGGSMGIALWPRDGDNAEALLHAADQAMYRAKESGSAAYSD